MIRKHNDNDIDVILSIWLDASVKAHDFIEPDFWASQLDNMRNIYIPASETWVYEYNSEVVGFYALNERKLEAIFVSPKRQGMGFGKALLSHAKAKGDLLTLCVYKENEASYQFYLSQGFTVIGEQTDKHSGHREYIMSTEQGMV